MWIKYYKEVIDIEFKHSDWFVDPQNAFFIQDNAPHVSNYTVNWIHQNLNIQVMKSPPSSSGINIIENI